jgi:hypothetical protein
LSRVARDRMVSLKSRVRGMSVSYFLIL